MANTFKSFDAFSKATKEELLLVADVGEIVADGIIEFFADEANNQMLARLFACGVTPKDSVKIETDSYFSGKGVVLTGKLENYTRDEAGKIIESLGGEIQSSVSKRTNILIAGEATGSKLEKAKKLGIEIIDEQKFMELIK